MKYKVGDVVETTGGQDWSCGQRYVITKIDGWGYHYDGITDPNRRDYHNSHADLEAHSELITTKGGNMKEVINNFLGLFLAEPEKTYKKLGIIGENNLITEEGTKILLTFLLKEGGINNKFFTEVAKPMLEEQEKEEK